MLCLELVETAPRMMSSTPRGKGIGLACLYYVISKSFSGLDTWDCFGISLYILSLHFWLRKDQGFAALVGIHVALCFDDFFLYVIVSSLVLCVSFSCLFF